MAVKTPYLTRCFAVHLLKRSNRQISVLVGRNKIPRITTPNACQSSGKLAHIFEKIATFLAFDNGNLGRIIRGQFRGLLETLVFEELAVCGGQVLLEFIVVDSTMKIISQ